MRCAPMSHLLLAVNTALLIACLDAPTAPLERSNEPSSEARSDGNMIEFESLAPGDQVAVHFDSRGCFHHFVVDLVLTRVNGGLVVAPVSVQANLIPSAHLVADSVLDEAALRRLDRLLAFFRADPGDGCTTVDHVTFRVVQGRLAGRSESYTDASCQSLERADIYPVHALFHLVRDSSRDTDT